MSVIHTAYHSRLITTPFSYMFHYSHHCFSKGVQRHTTTITAKPQSVVTSDDSLNPICHSFSLPREPNSENPSRHKRQHHRHHNAVRIAEEHLPAVQARHRRGSLMTGHNCQILRLQCLGLHRAHESTSACTCVNSFKGQSLQGGQESVSASRNGYFYRTDFY